MSHHPETHIATQDHYDSQSKSSNSGDPTLSPPIKDSRRTTQNPSSNNGQPMTHHTHNILATPASVPVLRRHSSTSLPSFVTRLNRLFASRTSGNRPSPDALHGETHHSEGSAPSGNICLTAIETLQAVRLTLQSSFEDLLGEIVLGPALADLFADMLPNTTAQNALEMFFNVTQTVQVPNS